MSLVSRDVFARTELHKEIVPPGFPGAVVTCDWCDGTGSNGRLYRFRTESDGGSKHHHKGRFCSKSCHNSYHA